MYATAHHYLQRKSLGTSFMSASQPFEGSCVGVITYGVQLPHNGLRVIYLCPDPRVSCYDHLKANCHTTSAPPRIDVLGEELPTFSPSSIYSPDKTQQPNSRSYNSSAVDYNGLMLTQSLLQNKMIGKEHRRDRKRPRRCSERQTRSAASNMCKICKRVKPQPFFVGIPPAPARV